jgi:hypothetical protein
VTGLAVVLAVAVAWVAAGVVTALVSGAFVVVVGGVLLQLIKSRELMITIASVISSLFILVYSLFS